MEIGISSQGNGQIDQKIILDNIDFDAASHERPAASGLCSPADGATHHGQELQPDAVQGERPPTRAALAPATATLIDRSQMLVQAP
jgi:hypothetical protein